jgi:hypothetical protein
MMRTPCRSALGGAISARIRGLVEAGRPRDDNGRDFAD